VSGSRLFALRNRLLTSPAFRRAAEKFPISQWIARRRSIELFRLCSGFIHSQVLLACVRLGLFERLLDGPLEPEEIAQGVGLPQRRCEHLLRAASALALLERRPDGRYGLGALGATLIDNGAVLALVEHHALLYEDLADPVALFAGAGEPTRLSRLWPYAEAERPEALGAGEVGAYSDLMAASQAMIAAQVLDAVSLRGTGSLLDLGGGSGAFVAAVAERWPRIRLALCDLPAVADLARARLVAAGLGERVEVVGADATRTPLPGGFDVVSLVRILHDHDDERALALLAAARRSLRPGGRLLVAEPLADAPGAGRVIDAYFSVYLLAMGSGKPRTRAELQALIETAGFRRIRRRRTRVPLIASVLVARA
jgi:demethylspheroidene O-methyltransferase